MTSILAMIYLMLFAAMAIGFYAQVNGAVQIARNEVESVKARVASESGLAFMGYQLSQVSVHGGEWMMDELYQALKAQLEPTENLAGKKVKRVGAAIVIPTIELGNGSSFSARVTRVGTSGSMVTASVTGTHGSATSSAGSASACRMSFTLRPRRGSVLDFGVVTKSAMSIDSNAGVTGVASLADGKVLIMSDASPALELRSNSLITGQVWFADATPSFTKSGNSKINGTTTPVAETDYLTGVVPPEVPFVDTSAFRVFATNVLSTGNGKYDTVNLRNVLIRANTNPTFGGSITVEGVIYVEMPNKVTFDSNMKVRGVIVAENMPIGGDPSKGDSSTNLIEFKSNTSFLGGPETLNATFDPALRAMTGSAILAPHFTVHFNSNFGIAGGAIIGGKVNFDSNSAGTIKGTVMSLDEDGVMTLNGNSGINFEKPPGAGIPAGMAFEGAFTPRPDTYYEGQ
jgi:hypothetical protein